jgi:hypothetical protein
MSNRIAPGRCATYIPETGDQCTNKPMSGFDRCHHHRQDSRRWREGGFEGRWQKYLRSENLADRYKVFFEDEQINNMRGEIAIIDTMLSDLISAYGDDASDLTWLALQKKWIEFMDAVYAGDNIAQTKLVSALDKLITDRVKFNSNRTEIIALTEQRRRLNESESKRMMQEQMFIPVERVMFMFQLVIGAAKESAYRYADQTTAQHIIDGTVDAYQRLIGVTQIDATDPRTAVEPE